MKIGVPLAVAPYSGVFLCAVPFWVVPIRAEAWSSPSTLGPNNTMHYEKEGLGF